MQKNVWCSPAWSGKVSMAFLVWLVCMGGSAAAVVSSNSLVEQFRAAGLAGNDVLVGNAGDDILNGGIGNDNLRQR